MPTSDEAACPVCRHKPGCREAVTCWCRCDDIEAAITAAVQAEREACALALDKAGKEARAEIEEHDDPGKRGGCRARAMHMHLAAMLVRARGATADHDTTPSIEQGETDEGRDG